MSERPRVAVVGAGLGGLAAAAALSAIGCAVEVYEQAGEIARVGAGIQLGPNAVKVLRAFGLEEELRRRSFRPRSWLSRRFDTGAEIYDYLLGDDAEARYGAPYLQIHRGDFHALLSSVIEPESLHLAKRLVGLDNHRGSVLLSFADGTRESFDAIVGADGVHSVVREILLGASEPRITGRVAYRAVFPTSLLNGLVLDDNTKWWGEDRHIVIYFLNPRRSELYFVTSVPEQNWWVESWSALGDLDELRNEFGGFHNEVRRVLEACPGAHKWALLEREPLERWSEGPVTLLGDACHPMVPYMAQGAAMALEDAAVLARCVADSAGQFSLAFSRYTDARLDRTARVQRASSQNRWMKGPTDGDWIYAYDAWNVPLA